MRKVATSICPACRRPSTVITPNAAPIAQRAPAAEDVADFVGRGARGDVVILGREAEQLIADAAARPQRLEPGGAELLARPRGRTSRWGVGAAIDSNRL